MIYAYGDSYIADSSYCLSWAYDLSKKLNGRFFNRAVSGSSTEFSIKKFLNDRHNFKSGDIVIFSFSTVGRLSLKYINDELPKSSCVFYGGNYKEESEYYWFKENEKNLEWFIKEIDLDMIDINFEGYHQIIRSFALANPDITFVVLVNTRHALYNLFKLDPLPNYIRPNFTLGSISNNEMISCNDYNEFVRYTKCDPRFNHLVAKNREILVDLLYDAIVNKNIDKLQNNSIFKTNIIAPIKNLKDYERYLNQGFFNRNLDIINELKNSAS